jgi:hypothetical protein
VSATGRGAPPADVDAVVQVVLAIRRLMQTVPAITEVDVNPLMVHAKGREATALDALIVTDRRRAAELEPAWANSCRTRSPS